MKVTLGHKWPLAAYEIREIVFEFDPEVDTALYLPEFKGSPLEKEIAMRNLISRLIRAEMVMTGAKISSTEMKIILDKEAQITTQLLAK